MSCSTTFDYSTVPSSCEPRMELHFAEVKQMLTDLIHKEQVNQLWKLGVESSLHSIWSQVCYQRACVSTSCQTDEHLQEDCDTLLEPSIHINGNSHTRQEEDNELNPEELENIGEHIPSSSSSTHKNEMAASHAFPEQHRKRVNGCKKSRSEQMKSYQCRRCEYTFSRKDDMLLHERAHDYVKLRVFTNRGNLAKHRRFCSGRQNEHLLLDETSRTIKEEENCLSSGAEKDNEISEQTAVVKVIHPSSLSDQESEISASDASPEQPNESRSEQTEFYQYSHCECKFSCNCEMLLHERIHEEETLTCDNCLQIFTNHSNYIMHRRFCSNQPHEKSFFECAECGKSFNTRDKFRNHSRYHQEKKRKCALCDKAFHRPSDLTRHMVTHTGARPFRCNFCQKHFSTSSSISKHIRKHHIKRQGNS